MRPSLQLTSLSALVLALSIGCGSSVNEGGGGAGGGAGGSGGEDPFCAPYFDEEPEGAVTFRVSNQTGQDLYLRGSCNAVSYSVDPEAGPSGTYYGDVGGSCQQSCQELQTTDPILCEADACAPSAILLHPGETRDLAWGGLGQKNVEMPAECWFSPEFGTNCQQIVAAPAGSYKLNLTAFAECGPGCTCDATGVCTGDATGIEAQPDVSTFALPAAGPIDIVFPNCAFGCP